VTRRRSRRRSGRKEEGRKEGADTELKTKTPHVNAGKKLKILFESLVG